MFFSAILYEFHWFCKISIHRFAGKNYWNLTFWTIFRNFTKKMKKWIYTGGVHPNDRFLMIFMLQTPVFFRVKVGSVGDETFLRKISEKISLTTAIRFLQNLSKNMEIFKILFFFGTFWVIFQKSGKDKTFKKWKIRFLMNFVDANSVNSKSLIIKWSFYH